MLGTCFTFNKYLLVFDDLSIFILGRAMVGTYIVCTGVGWYLYLLNDQLVDKYQVESRSSLIAITPLLDAEADRE